MESLTNIGNEFYQAIKEHYPMSSSAKSLDEMMRESLQDGGYAVSGGRDLFMEVMDTTTGLVWMSAAPVQLADFEALELEASMVKVGIARAPMDRAAFQYSPGAPEAPVLERVIDGRLYINVAAPLEQTPSALPGGPVEISVNKAHVIGFEVGRSVAVLSLPEGDFVEVVADDSADESLVLPEGGVLKRIELSQPWVVSLPTPTRTFFWFDKAMRSFQGPVTLPESN
jgi:hypothetical protein